MRLFRALLLAPLAAVLACALVACEDDDEGIVCCPGPPAGRIHGTVHIGDVPVDATVRAHRIVEDGLSEVTVQVRADTSGRYSMDVPAGRYVVRLDVAGWYEIYAYGHDGVRWGDAAPDTITIEYGSTPVIDFMLASLRMHVTLSHRLDGEDTRVQLYRRGEVPANYWRSYLRFGMSKIVDGGASIVLAGVLPGAYRVELVLGAREYLCYCPYDGEHVWYPATRDSSASPWVTIPPDETVSLEMQVAPETARIEGRVTGAWMELGLSTPPEFALVDPDSNVVLGRRVVGDDGRFGLDVHMEGPVKVLVVEDGVEQWIGGRTFHLAPSFDLVTGQTISVPELVQSGLVLDMTVPPGNSNDMLVRFYDASDLTSFGAWEPNSYGGVPPRVAVSNLGPGSYLMRIEPRSAGYATWAPQWYDRAADVAGAQPVTIVTPGEIVHVPVVLEAGGEIEGRVLADASGDYVIYATTAESPGVFAIRLASVPPGTFEVKGLADGGWKIGAWRRTGDFVPEQPPPTTVWYPAAPTWDEAETIVVEEHATVTGIEIDLRGR